MTNDNAILDGYTEPYEASSDYGVINIRVLVKPNADFDDMVKVWDCDSQEYLTLHGWNWTFERVTEDN